MNDKEMLASNPGASWSETAVAEKLDCLVTLMRTLADTVVACNKRMDGMTRLIEEMATLLPSQEAATNAAIRARAQQLAMRYRMSYDPKITTAIGAAIRRDVRSAAGVRAIRELPRCRHQDYLRYIQGWDDPKVIRAIRDKREVR